MINVDVDVDVDADADADADADVDADADADAYSYIFYCQARHGLSWMFTLSSVLNATIEHYPLVYSSSPVQSTVISPWLWHNQGKGLAGQTQQIDE